MNIVGGLSDRSVDSEFLSAESTTGTHAGTSGGNGRWKGSWSLMLLECKTKADCVSDKKRLNLPVVELEVFTSVLGTCCVIGIQRGNFVNKKRVGLDFRYRYQLRGTGTKDTEGAGV